MKREKGVLVDCSGRGGREVSLHWGAVDVVSGFLRARGRVVVVGVSSGMDDSVVVGSSDFCRLRGAIEVGDRRLSASLSSSGTIGGGRSFVCLGLIYCGVAIDGW